MPTFFCDECGTPREFVAIHKAQQIAGVSRSSIYHWIEKRWVHRRKIASGRTVICAESLAPRIAPVKARAASAEGQRPAA